MSTDTLPSLDDAPAHDLISWAMRVRYVGLKTEPLRCTVEQAERIVGQLHPAGPPPPEIEFGMDGTLLGVPVEWVTDPAESTFASGRKLAEHDADIARVRAEREAREAREDARHTQLLAAGGVVAAIAGLHSPDDSRDCEECQDGDFMSPWPCATWNLLDEQVPR